MRSIRLPNHRPNSEFPEGDSVLPRVRLDDAAITLGPLQCHRVTNKLG